MSNSPKFQLARDAGLAAVLTTILSLYVFLPIADHFTQPWAAGDMLSAYVAVDNWGFLSSTPTTEYGYPLGMNLNYFPGVDITENIFGKVINLISGNPFLGLNLLLFLSFPLTAALAVIALRMVGSRGPIAIMLASAFALIPYHWGRGLGHTYLATNYSVVTGVILALAIGTGLLSQAIATRNKLQLTALTIATLITAWTGVYYAVFALILMSAGILWRFAKGARIRELALNVIPIALTAAFVIAGFIPGILATLSDPPYAVLSTRLPYESVQFAGILIAALLPAPVFIQSIFSSYNESITGALSAAPKVESAVPTNFGTLVTSLAFIAFAFGLVMRSRSKSWKQTTKQLPLISYYLTIAVLFFIPWGLNYLFAGMITAQIRAWNRMLPVILLLAILAAGIVLSRTTKMTGMNRIVTISTITAVGIGATFINSVMPFAASYANSSRDASQVVSDVEAYSDSITAAVPENCGILQLPYMAYPENGPTLDLDDYGHFWPPLTQKNDSKSWSYGAVKNTDESTWMTALPEIPSENDIDQMISAGFCGIHIDSRGYVEPAATRINAELVERFGPPVATGKESTWNFYRITNNIQPSPQTLSDYFYAPAITADLPSTLSPGTVAPRGSKGQLIWWWTIQPEARFTISQLAKNVPISQINLGLRSSQCEAGLARVTLTDQNGQDLATPVEVLINPKTTTDISLMVNDPDASIAEATLTISTSGKGCDVAAFPYRQYVQVIDPVTR